MTTAELIEKLERAEGLPMVFACGHVASPENTKLVRNRTGVTCRICFRAMDAKNRARSRSALKAKEADNG